MTQPVTLFLLIPAAIALLSGCAGAPQHLTQRHCYHAYKTFEKNVGYCQAVRYGDTLYISGTAAGGKMPAAIKSAYTQLQKTLKANGLTFADVVRENVYTTNLDAFKKNKNNRNRFYGDTLPAASWVQVERLFTLQLVVEVELVAKYPH